MLDFLHSVWPRFAGIEHLITQFLQSAATGMCDSILIVPEFKNKERIGEVWLLGNSMVDFSSRTGPMFDFLLKANI